jgi:hypothetical protein
VPVPPRAKALARVRPPNAPTAPTEPVLPDGAGRPPKAPVSPDAASLTWAGFPNKGETRLVACSEDAGDEVPNAGPDKVPKEKDEDAGDEVPNAGPDKGPKE